MPRQKPLAPQYWGYAYVSGTGKWTVVLATYRYEETIEYQTSQAAVAVDGSEGLGSPVIFAIDAKSLKGKVAGLHVQTSGIGDAYVIAPDAAKEKAYDGAVAAITKAVILRDIANNDSTEIVARKAVIDRV